MKFLVNIRNNDNKCFLWCHIRHLNPLKRHPERKTIAYIKMVNDLGYKCIEFLVSKKDCKIEQKNNICINVFCYENELTYLAYVSNKKFENCMDLILTTEEYKFHYVYIKDFDRFMCNKTKNENKKHFCKYCLQCFSSGNVLQEHKETYLKIKCKQSGKLRSDLIKFKTYFKQLIVAFKIYADFESLLKGIQSNDRNNGTSYTEKYQKNIPCSFSYQVISVDDKSSKRVVLYGEKNAVNKFIKAIHKEYDYCKK